jgi:acyl phosphate:glycerol-3-phosphate acyltransferase
MLWTLAAVAAAYVLGSVPTGLWLGLSLRGVDIRQHGSCNIGATNTLRVLGWKLGAAALLGDAAKGLLAALLISRLSPWAHAPLACGIAAIIGHLAPVFLRFRGGKGVATSLGVFAALSPVPTAAAAAVFFVTLAVTRMVSAGSCLAALALAGLIFALPHAWATAPSYLLPEGPALRIVAALVAALVILKHRGNIGRIMRGEENRIGGKKRSDESG